MPPRRQPAPAAVTDAPAQTPAHTETPKRSRRARRAPTASDKTPPPPPPPAQTKTRRRSCAIPVGPEGLLVEPDRVGDSDGHAAARPHYIFDDDPEAAAAGAAPHPYVHFTGHDSDDGEYFPDPPASPSRSSSPTCQSSSQHRPHRRSPRAGPHASPQPAPNRKGTDRSGSANDVWNFFEPKEPQAAQNRECLFCKQRHAVNPHIGTNKFSPPTPVLVSCADIFYEHHVDEWIEGCDRLKIPIKAKEAAKYVDEYRHIDFGTGKEESAVFAAIVKWIVGDDQMSAQTLGSPSDIEPPHLLPPPLHMHMVDTQQGQDILRVQEHRREEREFGGDEVAGEGAAVAATRSGARLSSK
ncbi:hypothetical protein B0H14DRAFT_3124424 [Mycena olivaceomarginata]|nr:hypothetical protein B0H14DRAFT_3124424 [Mycena olivaceomarginata]